MTQETELLTRQLMVLRQINAKLPDLNHQVTEPVAPNDPVTLIRRAMGDIPHSVNCHRDPSDPVAQVHSRIQSGRCLVKGCENTVDLGEFVGNLCRPCHNAVAHGDYAHGNGHLGDLTRKNAKLSIDNAALRSEIERMNKEVGEIYRDLMTQSTRLRDEKAVSASLRLDANQLASENAKLRSDLVTRGRVLEAIKPLIEAVDSVDKTYVSDIGDVVEGWLNGHYPRVLPNQMAAL